MSVILRCAYCGGWIWLWQHMGWVVEEGKMVAWHTKCKQEGERG